MMTQQLSLDEMLNLAEQVSSWERARRIWGVQTDPLHTAYDQEFCGRVKDRTVHIASTELWTRSQVFRFDGGMSYDRTYCLTVRKGAVVLGEYNKKVYPLMVLYKKAASLCREQIRREEGEKSDEFV